MSKDSDHISDTTIALVAATLLRADDCDNVLTISNVHVVRAVQIARKIAAEVSRTGGMIEFTVYTAPQSEDDHG